MNIIVIEDHEVLREVTIAALQDMGHIVEGIESAEALPVLLEGFQANIMVLDLNLPGEDGISLAQRLRKSHPEIGIIMVTARMELDDKLAGYQSGADIYLTKPTSIEELGAAVQALSRRLMTWSKTSLQLAVDPRELTGKERIRALHQQLIQTSGKLPTLDELAVQYGATPRKLNEAFAAQYGLPIVPYITDYRLQQAHAAVENTNIPLKI
ncbi:MAG: response regulator, partial [Methylobacter sp.]|nr:response regulator [Methylobacter sp.]